MQGHHSLLLFYLITGMWCVPSVATAQAEWVAPRTSEGRPDLQGVWLSNAAIPMERPSSLAGRPRLTDEEVATLQERTDRIFRNGRSAFATPEGAFRAAFEDIETYDFMNHTLFDGDSILTDSMEFMKLNCFSLKHSSDLKSFINSISDSLLSSSDKKFMRNQLTDEVYLWDNERLINAWCLIPSDFAKINRSDTTDYWEEFRANFGKYGHHHYSRPIFNQDKNICVIEHSGQGDWLMGSGDILLFKKVNGNWRLLKEENLWIS